VSAKNVPVISVGACLALAAIAIVGFAIAGEARLGLALGAGFAIGSTNGLAARRALDSPIGFRASSLFRIAFMTVAALVVAVLIGLQYAWLTLFGVGGAQLVLVIVAARSLMGR
jgi:hypothetical protein